MVTIQQDYLLNDIDNLLIKYGNTTLDFNRQVIEDDIKRIKQGAQITAGKGILSKGIDAKNVSSITSYLERIIKKSENGPVTIGWGLDGNIINSYPIEMKVIPEYKVCSVDYINLKNEQVVYLDYTELANIIAFELMYRDMGETHSTMEEKLADIGIVSVYSGKALTKHFSEKVYELSKLMHVADSPYLVEGSGTITDYFGAKEFKSKSYKEVVSHSCRSAMSFIVEALLKKCAGNNIKFKLCGVFDTGIYLLVSSQVDSYIKQQLKETVYIRTFGRKLEVSPKIQVF